MKKSSASRSTFGGGGRRFDFGGILAAVLVTFAAFLSLLAADAASVPMPGAGLARQHQPEKSVLYRGGKTAEQLVGEYQTKYALIEDEMMQRRHSDEARDAGEDSRGAGDGGGGGGVLSPEDAKALLKMEEELLGPDVANSNWADGRPITNVYEARQLGKEIQAAMANHADSVKEAAMIINRSLHGGEGDEDSDDVGGEHDEGGGVAREETTDRVMEGEPTDSDSDGEGSPTFFNVDAVQSFSRRLNSLFWERWFASKAKTTRDETDHDIPDLRSEERGGGRGGGKGSASASYSVSGLSAAGGASSITALLRNEPPGICEYSVLPYLSQHMLVCNPACFV